MRKSQWFCNPNFDYFSHFREELERKDSYGHYKLQGEETLQKFFKKLKFDYISLRLPDVLGPRDNTNRFWKCFLWTKLNDIIGNVTIPKSLRNSPLSFVYSQDVAQLIYSLTDDVYDSHVYNQAYNLAFDETISLKDLFTTMTRFLGNESIEISEGEFGIGFPSVMRGPVDTQKAVDLLNWKPTPIKQALHDIIQFYNEAQFNGNYKYILDRVLEFHGIKREKYGQFVVKHHEELENRKSKEEL